MTEWRTAPPAIDSAFMELGGITRSRIVDELGAIAFSDIGDVVDWDNETEHLQPGDPGIKDTLGVKITKVIRPCGTDRRDSTNEKSFARTVTVVVFTVDG